jgi:hypothetical protein
MTEFRSLCVRTLNNDKATIVTCATRLLVINGNRVNLTFASNKNSPSHIMCLPTIDCGYIIKVGFITVRAISLQWRTQKIPLVRRQELRKITRQYLHNFVEVCDVWNTPKEATKGLNMTEKRRVRFYLWLTQNIINPLTIIINRLHYRRNALTLTSTLTVWCE